ncbi:MAG: helix-turn-helix domain-containing protein [Acidobacteria bacterium]|nr:helix-turn-helix domain-containing protein [Acidobacteriota bacterium]
MPDHVPEAAPRRRSYVSRWKHPELVHGGYVVVPTAFLQLYARLQPYPLTSGEALFVLHLMEFKWDDEAPFPGYKTLAARMGISDKMARRHAQSLETKKYLRRQMRTGQTNLFDLTPLFDALKEAEAAAPPRKRGKPQPSPAKVSSPGSESAL